MTIPPELVKEAKGIFHFNDMNNDGKLNTEELFQTFADLGILYAPLEEKEFKTKNDPDGKKLWDFNEYNTLFTEKATEYYSEDTYKNAFRIFDKEDTGQIDTMVLRRAFQTLGIKMTDPEINALLKEAGTAENAPFDYNEYLPKLL